MYRTHAGAGLCAACKYDAACRYRAARAGPILDCKEFEAAAGAAADPAPAPEPHPSRPASTDRSAGLCATCVHRAICIYPKPEGGVWRCEEYV